MRFFSISPSHRRTALCSSLPDLQAVAKEVLAGIFSGFSANLEVTEQTGFELTGHFTLAAAPTESIRFLNKSHCK
jgi:L-amino acid N-acyltransferase YncA